MAARDHAIKSMTSFDEQCEEYAGAIRYHALWYYTKIRDKLQHHLDSHTSEVRVAKLHELTKQYKLNLKMALCTQVKAHLKEASDDTWPAIGRHLHGETQTIVSKLSSALSSFEMDEQEKGEMISKLRNYGRGLVEEKARQEVGKIYYLMKERFEFIFHHGNDLKPRDWTKDHNIQAITKTAHSSSLKLLSVLAAIGLDGETDQIWHILEKGITTSPHLLDLNSWEEVPLTRTLITPAQCKDLWNKFIKDVEYTINQANALQSKANKKNRELKEWAANAAHAAPGGIKVVGTVCAVSMITIAATATPGHALVVAALGTAMGVLAGFVVVGWVTAVTVQKTITSAKSSVMGKTGYSQ